MKTKLFLIFLTFLFTSQLFGQTFYEAAYKAKPKKLSNFIEQKLSGLYSRDEQRREKALEAIQAATHKTLRKGDSFFPYHILGSYVLGEGAPARFNLDKEFRGQINKVQEKALNYLNEQAKESELSVSSREVIVRQLSKVAVMKKIHNFDLIEDTVNVLIDIAKSDNQILSHAAIAGLKEVSLKSQKRWSDISKDAVKAIVTGLDESRTERQRVAFLESLDILRKAKYKTPAIEYLWGEVNSSLDEIRSPLLQDKVKLLMSDILRQKAGSSFRDEIKKGKKELSRLEPIKKVNRDPLNEVLTLVKEEVNPSYLEAALDRLLKETRKDRIFLHHVYSNLGNIILHPEISDYKLRLLNNALITLTHDVNSPLFYYRTSLNLLGQIAIFRNSSKANISIIMLANLLSSTDHPALLLPILDEIYQTTSSNLPIWVQQRLVTLFFIQAGDSPNEEVALEAAKYLGKIGRRSNQIALKWEAVSRLQQLAEHAKEESVKQFATSWK